jgi:hypothetical protein
VIASIVKDISVVRRNYSTWTAKRMKKTSKKHTKKKRTKYSKKKRKKHLKKSLPPYLVMPWQELLHLEPYRRIYQEEKGDSVD